MAHNPEIRFRCRALFEVLGMTLSDVSVQESIPMGTLSEWKNDDREEFGGIWIKGCKQGNVEKTKKLALGLQSVAAEVNIPLAVNYAGGMFGYFFSDEKQVTNFQQVCACDVERFKKFFHLMLEQGIYLAPSAFEAGFLSLAHSDQDIEDTLSAAKKVFSQL